MSTQNELHVVFGTGPVGMAVIDELLQRGKRVRVVNRSGKASLPVAAEVVKGDVTNHDATREIVHGATVVYNCLNAPYTEWPRLFPALQKGVLVGAASAGAKLVVMENVYMYGPTHGKALTEDLPYNAVGPKGRTRAVMAKELLEAHQRGEVQVTAGRASDFFGPGVRDSSMGEVVFGRAVAGKPAQVLGKPDLPHTYHYVPDIGRALVQLGEREEAFGRAWHLPAAETLTTRAFIEHVYAAAGHPPQIQAAPGLLVRALGLFNPMMREFAEMMYEFNEPHIVDDTRYTSLFGNRATPLSQAIRATVDWYRQHAHATQPEIAR